MNTDHIAEYMQRVQSVYATGVTTEHSFRGALEFLFDGIMDDVRCINEPKQVRDVGRPDFVFKRTIGQNQITIGHCEAKDIDKDVTKRGLKDYSKEQFSRYIKGLPNLIYTNGLDFVFYVKGEFVREISIADFLMGITPKPDQYALLAAQLTEFAQERLQTITSAKRLAELMAGKALMIKEALFQSLKQDPELNSELAGQYKAFKDQLIHDLTPEGFADIYAETIAYGLFAARLHDDTLDDFSRQEALDLLPKSNPFLRDLFGYVAGPRLDERIRRDIDELAEIFQATDLQKLFADFGSFTKRNDPFIHFYETFLAEYNPKKRKARGVWYTPEPVVNFIVRAVDDVLKSEFGLPMGLADTSKITVDVDTGQTKTVRGKSKPVIEKREMHRVQILDPATGTGTFLAEVIKQIAPKVKDIAPGKWSRYVEQDLIPRIHGFELLMASYAMCHMKLDMMLSEMGYVPTKSPPRLSVYLTNSLEEGDKEVRDLFMAQWLSNEAKAANEVKRDKPIMCIIGNPPYSGHSSNKSPFIEELMASYKRTNDLKRPAQAKWLSDDYVKFIRLSEHMIAENKEGILAFITSHSYLDNPTFHDMRKHLLETFDEIKIIDLHGNATKQEKNPLGGIDKNVFDIRQGVAIIIASKHKEKSQGLAKVKSIDIWGSRKHKYDALRNSSVSSKDWGNITPPRNPWVFKPYDWKALESYEKFPKLPEIFNQNGTPAPGIVTTHDDFAVSWSKGEMSQKLDLLGKSENELEAKGHFRLCGTSQWSFDRAKAAINTLDIMDNHSKYGYRPFDSRHTVYDRNVAVHRRDRVMRHLFFRDNFSMVVGPQGQAVGTMPWNVISVIDKIFDFNYFYRGGGNAFPLYLYPEEGELDQTRRVNMDPKIRKAIEKAAMGAADGVPALDAGSPKRASRKGDGDPASRAGTKPDEVAIFDYIYGVLHCPAYRETYAEFLKIDFPRVPYPSSPESFWDISAKGTALRKLHLMETDAIGATPYPFIGDSEDPDGRDMIVKPAYEPVTETLGRVHISDSQYFDDVPLIAWEFYIGGYQPAQKWLKDRKGRELSWDDMQHYQKIIKILTETDRIMKTIEMDLG